MTTLDDFLSGDVGRVYDATWATIRTRDPEVLDELLAELPAIRRATKGLDLGGGLFPNRKSLEHAIAKLSLYRRGECWCRNYPGIILYDPRREEAAGHVRILSEGEPGVWPMRYDCSCTVCGRRFDVEEGEYHYTWWRWKPTKI